MLERLGLARPEKRSAKAAPEQSEPKEEIGGYAELTWSDDEFRRHTEAGAAIEVAREALAAAEDERDRLAEKAAEVEARVEGFAAQRAEKEAERQAALEALDVDAADDAGRRIATLDDVIEAGQRQLDGHRERLEGETAERVRQAEAALAGAEEAAARLSEEIGRLVPHGWVDVVVAHRAAAAAAAALAESTPADVLAARIASLPDEVARESWADSTGFMDQYEALRFPAPEVEQPWPKVYAEKMVEKGIRRLQEIQNEEDFRAANARTVAANAAFLAAGSWAT